MSQLIQSLQRIASDLADVEPGWALVGGFAVSVRHEPRTTRDIDVAVAVNDDSQAEQISNSLLRTGYGLVAAVEQSSTGRLATVRLLPPDCGSGGAIVDLLFASCGIEAEIVARADELEILPDMVFPVAQIGDLIAMKILSRDDDTRPQDAGDLRGLLAVAETRDLDLAYAGIEMITCRGFERERDLKRLLDDAVARWRK